MFSILSLIRMTLYSLKDYIHSPKGYIHSPKGYAATKKCRCHRITVEQNNATRELAGCYATLFKSDCGGILKPMKTRQRPPGITTLALFELVGTISYCGLLFFTSFGSRDFIALFMGAALGFVVVYGLWRLQPWAFWFTAAYEAMQILYELFLFTQPEYKGIHLFGPLFGLAMSAITLAYIFLDRSVKPVFQS